MSQPRLTPLLVDAKNEYVSKLADVLAPFVVNCFNGVYAHTRPAKEPTKAFQLKLREIPRWNANTIRTQVMAVEQKYTFLEDLIAAAFVAYVRVLSSVKVHAKEPNVNLQLPTTDAFVHRVFSESASEFFANPRLIKADRPTRVAVVRGAVERTIRDLLPIRDILRAYVGDAVSGDIMNTQGLESPYDDAQQAPAPADAPTVDALDSALLAQAALAQTAQVQAGIAPVVYDTPPVYATFAPSPVAQVSAAQVAMNANVNAANAAIAANAANNLPFVNAQALAPQPQALAPQVQTAPQVQVPTVSTAFLPAGSPKMIRVPGAFVTPEESPGLFSDADDL